MNDSVDRRHKGRKLWRSSLCQGTVRIVALVPLLLVVVLLSPALLIGWIFPAGRLFLRDLLIICWAAIAGMTHRRTQGEPARRQPR